MVDPFTVKEIAKAIEESLSTHGGGPDFSQGMSIEKKRASGESSIFDNLESDIPDFTLDIKKRNPDGYYGDRYVNDIPDFNNGRIPSNWLMNNSPSDTPVAVAGNEAQSHNVVEQEKNSCNDPEQESSDVDHETVSQDADAAAGKPEKQDLSIDDNGNVFKDENGNLLPNIEYEINGIKYKTDEQGRIVSWEGHLTDSSEERDNEAQSDVGGDDRLPDDHGGHLVANMNGGSSGNENLVPMRGHLNQGDYKKGESEENSMLKEGKDVYESGQVNYNGDSQRPSTIEKTYTDGEKTVEAKYDNKEGSTELLDDVKDDLFSEDYDRLEQELSDMKADGNEVSVTSVVKEKDSSGNLTSVTVGYRNETTGKKYYQQFTPNTGANNATNS